MCNLIATYFDHKREITAPSTKMERLFHNFFIQGQPLVGNAPFIDIIP